MYVYGALIDGEVCYVGQTVMRLAARKGKHLSEARKGRGSRFGKAIRKLGEDRFTFQIIERFTSQKKLDLGEQFWIRTYEPRFNVQSGGKVSFEPWNKGKKETRKPVLARISRAAKSRKRTKRGHYSEEHRRKIGEATLRRSSRKIVCEKTGEIFWNIKTAAEAYGLNPKSLAVLLGGYTRLKTLNGYAFTRL
jgi:group I intron endonuclease